MSRKLMASVLFLVIIMMISWSTGVLAEEKEQKSLEEQIHQVEMQIKEIEYVLERERNDKKAAALKEDLQERRKKLENLRGEGRKSEKPKGEISEIEQGIRGTEINLMELRQAVKALEKEGGKPEKLKELLKKLDKEERKLVELKALWKKRKAGAKRAPKKPRAKLTFIRLEHANAQNLAKIIQKFLAPSGIAAGDSDSNTLVIRAVPNDLEMVAVIIRNLDVPKGRRVVREQPRRRRDPEPRERAERENVFFGKVLEAGRRSMTIKTKDSGETVTLYVPVRRKDDGTRVPHEELSIHVASFDVGTDVKIQWRQGDERRFIQRVVSIKKEQERKESEARWKVFFGEVLESSKKAITIKTKDSGETVTIYVPMRMKEDGSKVPNQELAMYVASFDVGANVKVQWEWEKERRWIRRIIRIKE